MCKNIGKAWLHPRSKLMVDPPDDGLASESEPQGNQIILGRWWQKDQLEVLIAPINANFILQSGNLLLLLPPMVPPLGGKGVKIALHLLIG